ncbi:SIR2 family protein [Planctomicrobium sp. SH527]|uniref:SIR2 family protein n=1 Tax=Planctomicrobium sp. SH527 TaxID=3448123 RepID=UPI003F5B5815
MAWFLGAGASAASGIPTGYAMIRDFKAQIFCRETNLSMREIDTADPIWADRIDAFFRQTSLLPPDRDPTEYAKAFEAVYPEARHRRQYIDDAISKGTPCFGHKVFGGLIAAGKVDSVFTTNFDPLIEESAHSANVILPVNDQNRPTVAAIDSADRAMRCLDESDWPLVAKLHGDYQSIAIKNTGSELEKQDARMRHVLVESGKRFGMIFVGYSGRDASIMEALNSVLDAPSPFPSGLYWLTSSASRLLHAVKEFLDRALAAGVDVAVVECATFDELTAEIIKTIDLPKPLFDRVMEGRQTPRLVPVQLPTTEARKFPVLRYSSLLIESMPRTARRIKLALNVTSPMVRKILKENGVKATVAANGRKLAVFGRDQEIRDALAPLGATLDGEITLDPAADSWAMGLIYDALVRSLARRLPLIPCFKRGGHSLVIAAPRNGDDPEQTRRNSQILYNLSRAYSGNLTGKVPSLGFPFHEGLSLKLDHINGRWWLGFEPYTFIDTPRANATEIGCPEQTENLGAAPIGRNPERGGDPAGDWRRERWAQRYNGHWASIIAAWAELLTVGNSTGTYGRAKRAFGLRDGEGVDAAFELSPVTGWSRPGHHHVYFDRTT